MFVVGIVIFLLELEAYKYSNRHPHFFLRARALNGYWVQETASLRTRENN